MKDPRRIAFLFGLSTPVLLLGLALSAAGCGGGGSGAVAPPDLAADAAAADRVSGRDGDIMGQGCGSPEDCPGRACDPFSGVCVACLVDAHCDGGRLCRAGSCVEAAACQAPSDCPGGTCDPVTGRCADCLTDGQCGSEGICVAGSCVGPAPACAAGGAGGACPSGLVCSEAHGRCLQCASASDCGPGGRCGRGGICVAAECGEGQKRCETGGVATCGPAGLFGTPVPCPLGQVCQGGSCVKTVCQVGFRRCEQLQELRCNADGTATLLRPCPPGTWCPDGGQDCVPIRHRLLLIFDTSGSMDRYPGTQTLVAECAQKGKTCPPAWPVCETEQAPLSILSLSKAVFAKAIGSTAVQARAELALMRFPQTMRRKPSCKSGHYDGQDTITDDPGSTVTPRSAAAWFVRGLPEVLSVPFAAMEGGQNLPEVLRWLDFKESLQSTGQPCKADRDCGLGLCTKGTCQAHANPELRADGRTPIGKTLFYAGEYLRHRVFLDGRPCATQADCPSAGYRCTEGKCVDPIRHCRRSLILLFSDGHESVNQDPDDFFHPWVQAKRLAWGLGCTTGADCLGGATCDGGVCRVKGVDPTLRICSHDGEPCKSDGDCGSPKASCASPAVRWKNAGVDDHLTDDTGRVLRATVNVVDIDVKGSGNRWIATLGGGAHFTVSSQDPGDFLAKLLVATEIKDLEPCVPESP